MTNLLQRFSNPSFALLWYIVKQNRWGLIGIFSSIPSILLVDAITIFIFNHSLLEWTSKIHILLLMMLLPLLAMIVTYGELSTKTAKTGIPKFTFVHPISSLHLALIPILFGIVLSFTFIYFWFLIIAQFDNSLFEYSIIFATCVIAVVWLQFMAWRLSDAPYLTIIIFLILIALLFVFIVSLWNIESTPPLINAYLAQSGLILLMISGTWLAITSVKKERTNQSFGKKWKLSQVQFFGFSLPTTYTSKQQALFRFEWRVFGWMLPMSGIFMTSLLVFAIINLGSTIKIFETIGLMAFGLFYLPLFAPAEMAKNYLGSKSNSILSFSAQLPLSNFDLANVKLKLALKSIMVFLLIVLIPINLFLFSLEMGKNDIQPWSWLTANIGILGASLVWMSVNLLIPTLTWAIGGNVLSWSLKGKSLFNAKIVTKFIIAASFAAFISYRFYLSEEFRDFLSGIYPALNICVFLIFGLIFSRALKRFNHYYSQKEVDKRYSLKNIYFIALTLLLVFLGTLWLIGFAPQIKFHASFILSDIIILITLPFLNAPFSTRENRSR